MDGRFRPSFNRHWTGEIYDRYVKALTARLGEAPEFRLAETPVFLPPDLRKRLVTAADEIMTQLSEPERIERMKSAIPEKWNVPAMDALPSMAVIDFAIVRDGSGELVPRVIELQGFPSLASFEIVQTEAWEETLRSMPDLGYEWSCWFGRDRFEFLDLLARTVKGGHGAEHVILLDLDPASQKTRADFHAMKRLLDVDAVCPTELELQGRELWRTLPNGRRTRVRRIHNRIVFDELIRKGVALPFDFRDELDVEWVPHPNWYWVWSKYSLPFLDHETIPRATLLSELGSIPDDLTERFVLKPLFSFAGGGVNVEPTVGDVEAIPVEERPFWCIQEKVEYVAALEAPDGGGVKVEIRLMFFRPDDEPRLILAENLCRLSRGKMLGVDYNKDFTWVGSSVAIWPAGAR